MVEEQSNGDGAWPVDKWAYTPINTGRAYYYDKNGYIQATLIERGGKFRPCRYSEGRIGGWVEEDVLFDSEAEARLYVETLVKLDSP